MWIRPESKNEYYWALEEERHGNKQWHLTIGVVDPREILYLGIRSIQKITKNETNVSLVRYLRLSLKEGRPHLEGGALLSEQIRQLRLEELAEEKAILYGFILNPEKRKTHYEKFLQEYKQFQPGFEEFSRKISVAQK